jgi:hypothetical protein
LRFYGDLYGVSIDAFCGKTERTAQRMREILRLVIIMKTIVVNWVAFVVSGQEFGRKVLLIVQWS